MKIGIDARFIGRPGGIGRYTEELVRRLPSRAAHHEFILFLRDDGSKRLAGFSPPNVKKVRAEIPWYTFDEQIRLPGIIGRERPDLMHFPHWNVPLGVRAPFVLTIHDLLILEHPTPRASTLGPVRYAFKRWAHRLVVASAVRRARHIIVPSEFVRTSVATRFSSSAAKVVVIPEGVIRPRSPDLQLQIPGPPSILYVGNAYPHKNLERLLRAFARVRRVLPESELIIAGYRDYFFERVQDFAIRSGFSTAVRFIPSPDDGTLEALYRGAGLFVIPSFSEGFGLTPLEAMARGVPVAAARAGSLPEVLGDAAAYFNPSDSGDITETLIRSLRDSAWQSAARAKGQTRAAKYSWDIAAEKTYALYAQEDHDRSGAASPQG